VPVYQVVLGVGPEIVTSSWKAHMETGYAFRSYKFAKARIHPSTSADDEWDDEGWFGDNFPEAHIAKMQTPIKV